ncbi:MAG TPA: hypothetical protein V6C95_12135 [Coleofasciculaceae cyanobacterium]
MYEILRAAVLSGALVIGLVAGFPLGSIGRSVLTSPPSSDMATPQQD